VTNNGTQFKTTASIGSNKPNEKLKGTSGSGIRNPNVQSSEKKHFKNNKQSIVSANENSVGKKVAVATTKYSYNRNAGNTNSNLYSMIYQNRTKNLVSSYLKNIDSQNTK